MPKISEMRESKFLKKEDVGAGALMTIAGCDRYNVAKEGADEELKWCLTFHGHDKPLVLNSTNIQLCAQIFGSEDTDDWIGKQIVLYTDPTIMYAGKVVGGIRVRKPKAKAPTVVPAKPKPAPVPVREPGEDDEDLTADDIAF